MKIVNATRFVTIKIALLSTAIMVVSTASHADAYFSKGFTYNGCKFSVYVQEIGSNARGGTSLRSVYGSDNCQGFKVKLGYRSRRSGSAFVTPYETVSVSGNVFPSANVSRSNSRARYATGCARVNNRWGCGTIDF